jgi:hypothetical protein
VLEVARDISALQRYVGTTKFPLPTFEPTDSQIGQSDPNAPRTQSHGTQRHDEWYTGDLKMEGQQNVSDRQHKLQASPVLGNYLWLDVN